MTTLRIRRLRARYRLQAPEGRERLDGLLKQVIERGLDRALSRAGVPPRQEVCLRGAHAQVSVRLGATDESLVAAWSKSLADAIHTAWVQAGSGLDATGLPLAIPRASDLEGVVCYRSRTAALADMTIRVARQDLSRAWAWKQLGLWSAAERVSQSEAVAQLVQALVGEAQAVVPMLALVAALHGGEAIFAQLLQLLDESQWRAVVTAALGAAGVPAAVMTTIAESAGLVDGVDVGAYHRAAVRLVRASKIANAVRYHTHPAVCRTLAVLVTLEVEPILLRQPAAEGSRILDDVAAVLLRPAVSREARGREPAQPGEVPPLLSERPQGRAEVDAARTPEAIQAEVRRISIPLTRQGGVLFLLGLIEDLGLPARLVKSFPTRPFRWTMHALARTLAPMTADDPGALAFAGLSPLSRPPSEDEDPLTPAELAALRAIADEIAGVAQQRLQPLALPLAQVLPFICARQAEILADPGWIEARFALRDVSTDLRRAGLDLDPGYLPWLGVVVRFTYE